MTGILGAKLPTMVLPAERLAITLAGGTPNRVPVMAKIWVNLAARLTGTDLRDLGSGCALPADSRRENLETLVVAAREG